MSLATAFVSQAAIDAWLSIDAAEVSGATLTLREGRRQLQLTPAAHFVKVSGGGEDSVHLVGKVKREDDIKAMGGETYLSSVIVGEVAYDVAPGFLAEPVRGEDRHGLRAALAKAAARL